MTQTLIPNKRLHLSLPDPPGIAHKHFAAPLWLPEEKQGLVVLRRSRRSLGFAGRSWPLAFMPGSSQITPDHSPAVPFSPITVASQTLFTCLLETTPVPPSPRAFSRMSEGREHSQASLSGLSSFKFSRGPRCFLPWPHPLGLCLTGNKNKSKNDTEMSPFLPFACRLRQLWLGECVCVCMCV